MVIGRSPMAVALAALALAQDEIPPIEKLKTVTPTGRARSKPGAEGERFRAACKRRKTRRKASKAGRKASRKGKS